jgi:hypothetical protein
MNLLELGSMSVMAVLVVGSAVNAGRGLDASRALVRQAHTFAKDEGERLFGLPVHEAESVIALYHDRVVQTALERLGRSAMIIQGAGYTFTLLSLVVASGGGQANLATAISVALITTLIATPCAVGLSALRSRIVAQLDRLVTDAGLRHVARRRAEAAARVAHLPLPGPRRSAPVPVPPPVAPSALTDSCEEAS